MKERHLTLAIDYDQDAPNPNEDDFGWRLHSFSPRHVNYAHPEKLGLSLERDENGDAVVESKELKKKFKAGLAYFCSYFEHGQSMWFLKGEQPPGVEFQWDGTRLAGILIWEGGSGDWKKASAEKKEESAAGFLKNYTAWANGEALYYHIELVESPTLASFVDSCSTYWSLDEVLDVVRSELDQEIDPKLKIVPRGPFTEAILDSKPIGEHPWAKYSDLDNVPDPAILCEKCGAEVSHKT